MNRIAWRAVLVLAFSAVLACSAEHRLPEDADLELFIETSSRCVYADRAYSHNDDLLRQELGAVDIPVNWDSLVDSLLDSYGAEPDLWYEVYTEILERSRK